MSDRLDEIEARTLPADQCVTTDEKDRRYLVDRLRAAEKPLQWVGSASKGWEPFMKAWREAVEAK